MNRAVTKKTGPSLSGEKSSVSKYRNIFASTPSGGKPLLYTNVKIDSIASTKLAASTRFIAAPHFNSVGVAIYSNPHHLNETVKIEGSPSLLLNHGKPIHDICFSSFNPSLLASSTRSDAMVRIWQLPPEVLRSPSATLTSTTPKWGTEVDIPSTFLAGHEKKIEWMSFHPICQDIMSSSSSDGTVKIWSLENVEDRITLSAPDEKGHITGGVWNDIGSQLWTCTSSSHLCLFDPRATSEAISSLQSGMLSSKGCKVEWLHPDPLVIVSGFKSQQERYVHLFDTRKLTEPIQELLIDSSGIGLFEPVWDSGLPLLYLTSRGEAMRVLELQSSSLQLLATLKTDKPAAATKILSKAFCNTMQCEIARFIRLGTDGGIDLTTLHIPRVNGDSIFQEDLYPPLAMSNPDITFEDWVSNDELEPVMVDFQEAASIILSGANASIRTNPSVVIQDEIAPRKLRPSTAPAGPRSSRLAPQNSDDNNPLLRSSTRRRSYLGESNQDKTRSSIASTHTVAITMSNMDLQVELEKRGWLSSIWETRHLLLRGDKLYISQDERMDSPLTELRMIPALFRNFSRNDFAGGIEIGFQVEYCGILYRLKSTHIEKMKELLSHIEKELGVVTISKSPSESQRTSSSALPPLPTPTSHSKSQTVKMEAPSLVQSSRAVFLSSLGYLKDEKGEWIPQLAVLKSNGFLHLFADDMKAYASHPDATPQFTLNLAHIISIQTCTKGMFRVWYASHSYLFKTKNEDQAAAWVKTIQDTITEFGILPASEFLRDPVASGFCNLEVKASPQVMKEWKLVIDKKTIWVALVNATLVYFDSEKSLVPIKVIQLQQMKQFQIDEDGPGIKFTLKISILSESGQDTVQVAHHFQDMIRLIEWKKALDHAQRLQTDWVSLFGFISSQSIHDSISITKSTDFGIVLEGDSRVYYHDEQKIAKSVGFGSSDNGPRVLYSIQGKIGSIRTSIVKPDEQSLRDDESFVLDLGMVIYHWHGSQSSRIAQAQALNIASELRKSRSDRPRVFLVEPDEPEIQRVFASKLGTTAVYLQSLRRAGDYSPTSPLDNNRISLPRPSEHLPTSNDLFIFQVKTSSILQRRLELVFKGPQQKASKAILTPEHIFIVWDIPAAEVFVWVGNLSSEEDKTFATCVSHQLVRHLSKKNEFVSLGIAYPDFTPVIFKAKFSDYEGSLPIQVKMEETAGNIARDIIQKPINVPQLLNAPPIAPEPLHDGKGKLDIFRVNGFNAEPISSSSLIQSKDNSTGFGIFSRKESYILLFTYRPPMSGVDRCVTYFWQGSESTITEKGTSALLTIEKTSGMRDLGDITHVRVPEGKEPPEWYSMFSEGIVILLKPVELEHETGPIVFDIRAGAGQGQVKAVQLNLAIDPLVYNSCHVLLVVTTNVAAIWGGKWSLEAETNFARQLARTLLNNSRKKILTIHERKPGNISTEEGDAIGAWKDMKLPLPPKKATCLGRYQPRLFACSGATGAVEVNEILNFAQEDLEPNSVFILDAKQFVFVWFGNRAKPNEKIIGMETAQEYVRVSKGHDAKKTILAVTFAYQEPTEFSLHFQGWTRNKFPKDGQTANYIESHKGPLVRPLDDVLAEYKRDTFSIKELLHAPPEFLDKTKLEMYLSPQDFQTLFGMTKEAYSALQPWKRDKLRKKAGFF